MRDYAKVAPTFWTGRTGREIKRRGFEGASRGIEGASKGFEGVVVALYLMTSPHSNMLGLYYQPILYLAHETGMGFEGASKGLQICVEAGFCRYDRASEMVWVMEMAAYQIALELKASDKRCTGIQKEYDTLPDNPFLGEFFDRYQAAFHLTNRRESIHLEEAPSKPLRSQEQEQEQEQEQDKSSEQKPLPLTLAHPPPNHRLVTALPLAGSGGEHQVLEADLPALIAAYPAVDVRGELKRMRVWLEANPRRRKTAKGIRSFIAAWLARQQDAPRGPVSSPPGDADDPFRGAK